MRAPVLGRLELQADTAAELMSGNPVSVNDTATVREALAMLIDKGFSAAPVIDEAGRPVGVLSCTDLLVHDRETADVENGAGTLVRDLMTPSVFSVALDTPAAKVVSDLLSLKVHRLFVVDDRGALVGVISATDILRHLRS